MVGESIRGLVLVGLCAAAALSPASAAARGAVEVGQRAAPRAFAQRPRIHGAADATRAWLGAEHRGLVVHKFANKADGALSIELQFRRDHVSVAVSRTGAVAVARGGRRIDVSSIEAFEQLQGLLAGSEVVFAVRVLLAERESTSDLDAPEMSLLSAAAFVASLVGDVDAPRRLSTRFVQKHRGIYRPVRLATCFEQYAAESSAAWNDMQNCMSEANQDPSLFARAYRRVACNAIWLIRAESAWTEYLGCLGPGQFIG